MQEQVPSVDLSAPGDDPPPSAVAPGSRDVVARRLGLLRAELARRGLAGFVVPLADAAP